jgi:hypothetical protein
MRHKRLLILLVALLAVTAAVWRAPASLAANWLEQNNHPLQLQMTAGTLWNGSARQARWQGLILGESSWQFRGIKFSPLSLVYEINSEGRQFQLSGRVHARASGDVHAEQLAGRMPAAWVDLQSFIPLVFLTGHFDWQIAYLDWPQNGLPAAAGTFLWRQAGLAGLAQVDLGELTITLEESAEQMIATVRSVADADVRINGQILSDGDNYTLDAQLQIAARRDDIFDLLAPLGKVQADGTIRFNWTGKLFPQ